MAVYVRLDGYVPTAGMVQKIKIVELPAKKFHFETGGFVYQYDETSASLQVSDVKIGDQIRFVKPWEKDGKYWQVEHIRDGSVITKQGDPKMAKIYDAAVLQTKTVPAGEGVSTGVAVQEVVHIRTNFTSVSDEIAKATVIAEAAAKGVRVDDPLKPIEVRLRSW